MPAWNADTYLQFERERTLPAIDLAAKIPLKNPAAIIDIGCGPGNSTGAVKRRFPHAEVTGIDNSAEMIKAARINYPDNTFTLLDAADGLASLNRKFDVVFSNAALQWMPQHQKLLPQLAAATAANGVLAVQIPYNDKAAISKIIARTVANDDWSVKLSEIRPMYTLKKERYYDILCKLFGEVELWETTYYHTLSAPEDILNWYKGTGLRPYLEQLNDYDHADFCRDILDGITAAYRPRKDGKILFGFNRLFFIAKSPRG